MEKNKSGCFGGIKGIINAAAILLLFVWLPFLLWGWFEYDDFQQNGRYTVGQVTVVDGMGDITYEWSVNGVNYKSINYSISVNKTGYYLLIYSAKNPDDGTILPHKLLKTNRLPPGLDSTKVDKDDIRWYLL